MVKKLTTEQFKERAVAVHSDKYDYKDVVYAGSSLKVIIWCPSHGRFEQYAGPHLQGRGCRQCQLDNNRFTKEKFVEQAELKHGKGKYDYTETIYGGCDKKVIIKCNTDDHASEDHIYYH